MPYGLPGAPGLGFLSGGLLRQGGSGTGSPVLVPGGSARPYVMVVSPGVAPGAGPALAYMAPFGGPAMVDLVYLQGPFAPGGPDAVVVSTATGGVTAEVPAGGLAGEGGPIVMRPAPAQAVGGIGTGNLANYGGQLGQAGLDSPRPPGASAPATARPDRPAGIAPATGGSGRPNQVGGVSYNPFGDPENLFSAPRPAPGVSPSTVDLGAPPSNRPPGVVPASGPAVGPGPNRPSVNVPTPVSVAPVAPEPASSIMPNSLGGGGGQSAAVGGRPVVLGVPDPTPATNRPAVRPAVQTRPALRPGVANAAVAALVAVDELTRPQIHLRPNWAQDPAGGLLDPVAMANDFGYIGNYVAYGQPVVPPTQAARGTPAVFPGYPDYDPFLAMPMPVRPQAYEGIDAPLLTVYQDGNPVGQVYADGSPAGPGFAYTLDSGGQPVPSGPYPQYGIIASPPGLSLSPTSEASLGPAPSPFAAVGTALGQAVFGGGGGGGGGAGAPAASQQ